MKKIIVIGSGGLAREFCSFFRDYQEPISIVGFSSINIDEYRSFSLPGRLFGDYITPDMVGTNEAVIAVSNPSLKKIISERLVKAGFFFPTFIHYSSVVSNNACLGRGVIVSPNCTVSSNVQINDFCYLNFGVGIGHDSVIESFCQINPGSQLGGFSYVGEATLLGSGVTVLQGVKVGKGVTVAAGSVVFTQVLDGYTIIGNPAKRMQAFEK